MTYFIIQRTTKLHSKARRFVVLIFEGGTLLWFEFLRDCLEVARKDKRSPTKHQNLYSQSHKEGLSQALQYIHHPTRPKEATGSSRPSDCDHSQRSHQRDERHDSLSYLENHFLKRGARKPLTK